MQYTITKEQLSGIKANGTVSTISVLNLFNEDEGSFQLQDPIANEILLNPDYVAQVTLVNPYTFFDCKLSIKNNTSVSLISTDDQYLVDTPAELESIITGLEMYMGNSILLTSNLDVKLSYDDAFLLTTIFDLFRSKQNLIENILFTFTQAEVETFTGTKEKCINSYLQLESESAELGSYDILETKNLISKLPDGYCLTGDALSFMNEFGKISNYISVQAIATARAGFTAVQSGLYTILYMEKKDDLVHLQAISPGILLEVIDDMLRKNEKLCSHLPNKSNVIKNFCTNCGKETKEGPKFCGNCGSKLQ